MDTERSENFHKVEGYYIDNLWDKSRVYDAVGKWITPEEYEIITDEVYE